MSQMKLTAAQNIEAIVSSHKTEEKDFASHSSKIMSRSRSRSVDRHNNKKR
eukprot:Awhi_evm1s3163